jgi:hypothetical protein
MLKFLLKPITLKTNKTILILLLILESFYLNSQNNKILILDTSSSLILRDSSSINEKIDFQYKGILGSYNYYYFINKYLITTTLNTTDSGNTRNIFLYNLENDKIIQVNHKYVNEWVYNYHSFFVDNDLKNIYNEKSALIKSLILVFSRTNFGTDFYENKVVTTNYGEFIELFDDKSKQIKKINFPNKYSNPRFISPTFVDNSRIAFIERKTRETIFSYTSDCRIVIFNINNKKIELNIPWNNLHHIRANGDYILVFEIPQNYLELHKVYMHTYLFNWKKNTKKYLGVSLDATFTTL